MKKTLVLFFLLVFFVNLNLNSSAQDLHNNLIAKINGEDILQDNFNRLLNTQKKKFYADLNFDLLTPSVSNPKATLKREVLIKEAKEEGITANANDFNKTWKDLREKYGSIENLENKARENNLTISDIRKKIEENILLEKSFEKQIKEKLIEKLVNETLLLQEAKARNIAVPEEEIIKKLAFIKEKQGGEESFNRLLSENNATVEDAKKEIQNQILIQLVKNQISNLDSFISEKRLASDVIIYVNKIFPSEPDILANIESIKPAEHTNAHLTATKFAEIEGVQKADEEINNLLAKEIQKEEEIIEPNIQNKEYAITKEEIQEESPRTQEEKKIFISDIKESTIVEPINVTGTINKTAKKGAKNWIDKIQTKHTQTENEILVPGTPLAAQNQEDSAQSKKPIETELSPKPITAERNNIKNNLENSSKTLQELRKKIEQRRFANR